MAELLAVHIAAQIGGKELPAPLHEGLQIGRRTGLQHEQHGSHHHVVAAQILIGAHHVHVHPQPEEFLPDADTGLLVFLRLPAQALHALDGPAVVPVEEHSGFRLHQRPGHGGYFLQKLSYLCHLFEDSGIVRPHMVHHRAVELLGGAPALAPLEILHGVGAAGHRLETGQPVDARALHLVHVLPVHQAGGALHHHERYAAFQGTHQRMLEGRLKGGVLQGLPVVVEGRIIVPGHHVHVRGHLPVVQPVEHAHQIGRHGNPGGDAVQHGRLRLHEVIGVPCGEALPLQAQAHDAVLAVGEGRLYLVEIIVAMAPERRPPGVVELLDVIVVLFGQILPEPPDAVVAVALPAELVGDMVHDDAGVGAEPFRQLPVHEGHLFPVDGGAHAMVVAAAVVFPLAHPVHPPGLRVSCVQPGGPGSRGRGQHGVDAVLVEPVYDLLQPFKMEVSLFGLQDRPGKNAHAGAVDAGLLHQPHVLLQDVRPVQPLLRVVVAAVDQALYLGEQNLLLHMYLSPFCLCISILLSI